MTAHETVRHHIGDDLLLAHAAGTLSEGWSLAVASHLALCPICRAAAARLDAVGGAALEEAEPAALGGDALARALSALDGAPPEPKPAPAQAAGVLPAPLAAYIGGDVDKVRWKRIGGGVRQMILDVEGDAVARLLFIPPKARVPEHGHSGLEVTMVLAGSFVDGGEWFRRGDVQTADEEMEHTPVSGPDADCICLAVTDAPLKFRGWAPKLVQRFARI